MQNDKELWVGIDHIQELQSILKLLTTFDEKTGRCEKYEDRETHEMRKAIANAEPEKLNVAVQCIGDYNYRVIAECLNSSGYVITSWTHQDDIQREKDIFASNKTHPIHGLVNLTDLFRAGFAVDTNQMTYMMQALAENGEY